MAIDKKKDSTKTCYGFFTLEKNLIGKYLPEIEKILGYETGRLYKGAAFYLLNNPSQTADFNFMGTTKHADHQVKQKAWLGSLNTEGRKEVHLGTYMQERLIKVYPISKHDDWICRHLNTEQTYMYQRATKQLNSMSGNDSEKKLNELLLLFVKWPDVQETIKKEYDVLKMVNSSDKVLDKVYPPSYGGTAMQWSAPLGIKGQLVCEMSNYGSDRYYPKF
jgi:hypothetical protein